MLKAHVLAETHLTNFDGIGYNGSMIKVILVYLFMALAIAYIEIKEDLLNKKIADGYKPNAKDGDKDGIVQDGTKWERSI
jgi:hypothetical protein